MWTEYANSDCIHNVNESRFRVEYVKRRDKFTSHPERAMNVCDYVSNCLWFLHDKNNQDLKSSNFLFSFKKSGNVSMKCHLELWLIAEDIRHVQYKVVDAELSRKY